ncbi:MAG: integrase core domain-containing protein [Devosia sp.]
MRVSVRGGGVFSVTLSVLQEVGWLPALAVPMAVVTELVGSMGRRGNPYKNALLESLMKPLKVEGVYPLEFETAEDVAGELPATIEKYNARRLHSSLGYLSPEQYEKQHARSLVKDAA